MLALYLLMQLLCTHWDLFLKANLVPIWHIAAPLSLRNPIICLQYEHRVIKIQSSIDHLAFFFFLSSLEQLLSAKAFVCFFPFMRCCFFFLYIYTRKTMTVCVLAFFLPKVECGTFFQQYLQWKGKLALPDTTSATWRLGGANSCSLFQWLKRGWHLAL